MSSYKSYLIFVCLFFSFSLHLQAQKSLVQSSEDLAKNFTTKDTLFKEPYVDIDEWRDVPVRHRYVHGGFKGTETKFSFYFPPKEKYEGRFFQYITPTPDNETLSQNAPTKESDKISFCIESGAYFIETNGGGPGALGMGTDPSIGHIVQMLHVLNFPE